MTRALLDLSHHIEHGLVTYRGLPPPVIGDWLSREASVAKYAPGTTFQIGKIEMIANTGTYIDAPFHRYADGKDLADLPLERVADLEGLVVRAAGSLRTLDADRFRGVELQGRAVLVHTGWDRHWGTERYFTGYPFLTAAAARQLVDAGAALVGIDSLNIDDDGDPKRPVHTMLLGAGIPIVEHLCNLEAVPDERFRFFALPAKVRGMGSFPVRAIAVVER